MNMFTASLKKAKILKRLISLSDNVFSLLLTVRRLVPHYSLSTSELKMMLKQYIFDNMINHIDLSTARKRQSVLGTLPARFGDLDLLRLRAILSSSV